MDEDDDYYSKRPIPKLYQEKKPPEKACTLEDFIINLFKTNQTNTEIFQTMVNLYGKEKIAKIWEDHFHEGDESPPECPAFSQNPPKEIKGLWD